MSQPNGRDAQHRAGQRLQVRRKRGETDQAAVARTVLHPAANAARTAQVYSHVMAPLELDLPALVTELDRQSAAVSGGDTSRPEALLLKQAQSLDAIFHSLVVRASSNLHFDLEKADRLMRLAFKAQSQCRATVETLATVKNPPTIIARQANVTSGP